MTDEGAPAPPAPDPADATAPLSPPAWERRSWSCAVLALVVFLAYGTALQAGFVFDDVPIARDNPRIRSLANLPILWTSTYWGADSPHLHYRPVTLTSFALDWAVWGPRPFGFHLTNVLLHLAVCLLLRELLVGLFGDASLALLASLLFAIHPLHTDAVTPVAGRSELLALGFVLAALLAHRRARAADAGAATAWTAASAACILLGALSKESALVAPGLLWLCDRMVPAPATDRRTWIGVGAGALALVAFFALRWLTIGALGTGVHIYDALGAGPEVRFPRAFAVLGDALRLHLVPWPLAADYAVNHRPDVLPIPWTDPATLLGLGGIATLTAVAVRGLARPGPAAFGAGWFLLAIVPVSNLVVEIGVVQAERILYLASAGTLILFARAMIALRPPPDGGTLARRLAFSIVLTVSYGGLSLLTLDRNWDWRSNETMFQDLIAKDERNPTGWAGLSNELRDMGFLQEARNAAERAVKCAPGKAATWAALGSAAFAAGGRAAGRGDTDGAQTAWREAAEAYGQAIAHGDWAAYRRGRAAALALLGEPAQALADLERALALAPHDPEVWTDLGIFWAGQAVPRDPDKAQVAYGRALELLPNHARARYNRGLDALQRGDPAAALPDLEAAFRHDPFLRDARLQAARAASAAGVRVDEAIVWVEEALAQNDADPAAWLALEAIYDRHGPPEKLAAVRARLREIGIPSAGS